MKNYLLKLFEYNDWANKSVLALLQKEKVEDEKILTLMGHVLAGEILWLNRIVPGQQVFELWKKYTIDELHIMQALSAKNWFEFIRSSPSFEEKITYKNTNGDKFVSEINNVMIHVVNHASYHRGQIAILLRQNGVAPAKTDFIVYERTITKQI